MCIRIVGNNLLLPKKKNIDIFYFYLYILVVSFDFNSSSRIASFLICIRTYKTLNKALELQ